MSTRTCTLFVYGDHFAAVFAALSAAERGVDVIWASHTPHVGHPLCNGLGATDGGRKSTLGVGKSMVYKYLRILTYLAGRESGLHWRQTPTMGRQAIRLLYQRVSARLVPLFGSDYRVASVTKSGAAITSVTLAGGDVINCTYAICGHENGDLAAAAGVTLVTGRESADTYNESFAGFRPSLNSFREVNTRDGNGNLLFGISPYPDLEIGEGDHRVQAYTFRLAATQDPSKKKRWPKPSGYDPALFELLRRTNDVTNPNYRPFVTTGYCAEGVIDINGDYGMPEQHAWPTADVAGQEAIRQKIFKVQAGWFWFLANDSSVHPEVRSFMKSWGLVNGEFMDNTRAIVTGWSYELYTRVCRRMVGTYVMKQKDVKVDPTKAHSIGMGFYSLDHHYCDRYEYVKDGVLGYIADGFSLDATREDLLVVPYQIPYESILPVASECTNLLVVGAVSCSYVAAASMRIDMWKGNLGAAAGIIIAYCAQNAITNLTTAISSIPTIQTGTQDASFATQGLVYSL